MYAKSLEEMMKGNVFVHVGRSDIDVPGKFQGDGWTGQLNLGWKLHEEDKVRKVLSIPVGGIIIGGIHRADQS